MAEVGKIEYVLSIDTENFKSQAKSAENSAKDLSSNLSNKLDKAESNGSKSFNNLGSNAFKLVAKLTAIVGAGKLVSDAFGELKSLETARMSFEVLTGSVETASNIMKDAAE